MREPSEKLKRACEEVSRIAFEEEKWGVFVCVSFYAHEDVKFEWPRPGGGPPMAIQVIGPKPGQEKAHA